MKMFYGEKKEYNLHFIVSSLTWDLHELRLYEGFLKIFSGEKIFVAIMGVSFFRFVAIFTFVIFVSLNNYLSEYESLNCQLFKIIHSEKCADVIYRMDLK